MENRKYGNYQSEFKESVENVTIKEALDFFTNSDLYSMREHVSQMTNEMIKSSKKIQPSEILLEAINLGVNKKNWSPFFALQELDEIKNSLDDLLKNML